ncbi:50S ribosomal protein L25/general stress protein Ctc [Micrococcus lylae]|uniref:50S ribosomal protein L25/general stress protein Ctc n=1 Tax=Micrococcus lylae TaxID=1273 RepID=UPI0021A65E7C|nr:50S ribosomal protein L25/general stress protein Ctc [Micrococcus lylae]MCT2006773.1 50S ribosomal protein L25/general stress protein Ctc [Micrococcus lylae]MCT2070693.1 50S ribosomal protein L25/general stress protein Ctc [Micrococcus lylae]
MSDQLKIKVTRRTDFGKGAARQARRAGLIPAVVYGHGQEPVHLLLPAQETTLAVRNPNALLTVVNEAGEEHLVLPKDIQRHPIKMTVDHLDLIEVRRGEKVIVEVPVYVEGEVAPGTTYNLDQAVVSVEAEATNLPESVTANIEGREAGDHLYASDLQLPAGVALDIEEPAEYVIVSVFEPIEQDLGDESVQEEQAAEGAEGGESEGSDDAEGSED